MWAFGDWARSSCNILYPRWHDIRCGCVLRCAAYIIPVFALVSTCAHSPHPSCHTVVCLSAAVAVALRLRGQTCLLCSHSLTRVDGL